MIIRQILKFTLTVSFTALLLSGCKNHEEPKIVIENHKVGGDRDAHGCIGSAGYQWCAKENQCVRSWELAKDKQFENSQDEFNQYCK